MSEKTRQIPPAPRAADPRADARRLWFGRYPGSQTFASFLLAVFITAAVSIEPGSATYAQIRAIDPTATGALYICYEVLLSFAGHDLAVQLLALACLLTFPVRYVLFGRRDSWRPSVTLPALAFGVCMVFGRSYDLTDGAYLVVGGISCAIESAIAGAGWALAAQVGIYLAFECFDWFGAHRVPFSESRYGRLWGALHAVLDRHPFLGPALLLALVWSPALVGSAPGIFMGDTGAQIRQWFNLPNGTSDYLNLLNPEVLLNAHHPVAHTALLGSCVEAGMAFLGGENAGVMLYTCLQYAVTVASVAYMLSALRRLGANLLARSFVLAFFLFMPLFANYAVLITKDTLFADAVLVLVVQMAKMLAATRAAAPAGEGPAPVAAGGIGPHAVPPRMAPWRPAPDTAVLLAASLGCAFLRNGGAVFPLAALLLAAFFALVGSGCGRRDDAPRAATARATRPRRPWARTRVAASALGVLAVTLMAYLAFAKLLMPALDITPGSRREALSIPFQQTARYVQKHDGAHAGIEGGTDDGLVTDGEREVIDRVLGYADLAARYDPDKSDAVKNGFNEDATAEDLAAYFRVWAAQLARDPESYLSAAINNYYGYFYPSSKSAFFYSTVSSEKIMRREENVRYFDFHHDEGALSRLADHFNTLYRVAVQRVPLASLALSSATYVWTLVIVCVYLLRGRAWRSLALMVPLLGVLAVCLIGPCNGSTYMRYLYPAIVSLPFACVTALASPRPLGSGAAPREG